MFYGRYGSTKQISDEIKAFIFAGTNDSDQHKILNQIEVCQNFADFFSYEIVGIATEVETLFKSDVEFDAVIVTKYNRLSRNAFEFMQIKNKLLQDGKIIIQAVRSY